MPLNRKWFKTRLYEVTLDRKSGQKSRNIPKVPEVRNIPTVIKLVAIIIILTYLFFILNLGGSSGGMALIRTVGDKRPKDSQHGELHINSYKKRRILYFQFFIIAENFKDSDTDAKFGSHQKKDNPSKSNSLQYGLWIWISPFFLYLIQSELFYNVRFRYLLFSNVSWKGIFFTKWH